MAPSPKRYSAVSPCFHGFPAFLHRHFPLQSPPPIPTTRLSTVHSSPRPGVAPQPLNSSSQLLPPGDLRPCPGMYGCGKDCLILIPLRLPQISCFTPILKPFSSDSVALMWGSDPMLQFFYLLSTGPVLLTLLFFPLVPLSYRVLLGSIYYFPWSGPPVRSQLLFCMNCRV